MLANAPVAVAAAVPAAAPAGKDLERWFWKDSEALADLQAKHRFRALRRLVKRSKES